MKTEAYEGTNVRDAEGFYTFNDQNAIESFPGRLREAMKNDSVRTFARDCGLSEGVIRKYLDGKSLPTLDRLLAIARAAGVELSWLACGEEPKYAADRSVYAGLPQDDEFIYVNSYDIEASAGHGAQIDHELVVSRMAFRKDWIEQERLQGSKLCIITAKGDSMEPIISNNDILLMEMYMHQDGSRLGFGLEPGRLIPNDGVYVIRLDSHLMVKRLQLDMQGGLFIKSDNPTYNDIQIPRSGLDDLVIVGRVVWAGHKM